MSQNGEINLSEVKAKYSIKDINFVDCREVDFANEFRLTSEISFAIGLTLLGSLITNFNFILLLITVAFILFGVISMYRYIKKHAKIKPDTIK